MAQKSRTIVLDFADIRNTWMSAVEDGNVTIGRNQPMYSVMENYYRNPGKSDGFVGSKPKQTCDWIRNGYRAPEFAHSAEYAALSESTHWSYDEEEGEIDIDRVMSGYDHIFLDREQRESRPGIRLMFEYAFAWNTSPKVISQYGTWCASLITSLESSGYDLVVDVWIHLDGLFQGDGGTRTSVLIRVKQENELSNFTDWSALFAPSGYRHLGFLAKQMAGDKVGKTVTHGYGMTIGGQDWGVTYDKENQLVQVRVNQRSGATYFPGDRLNEDAMEVGLIPQPITIAK